MLLLADALASKIRQLPSLFCRVLFDHPRPSIPCFSQPASFNPLLNRSAASFITSYRECSGDQPSTAPAYSPAGALPIKPEAISVVFSGSRNLSSNAAPTRFSAIQILSSCVLIPSARAMVWAELSFRSGRTDERCPAIAKSHASQRASRNRNGNHNRHLGMWPELCAGKSASSSERDLRRWPIPASEI